MITGKIGWARRWTYLYRFCRVFPIGRPSVTIPSVRFFAARGAVGSPPAAPRGGCRRNWQDLRLMEGGHAPLRRGIEPPARGGDGLDRRVEGRQRLPRGPGVVRSPDLRARQIGRA